ncbi:MAG TPA: hypothetical protein DCO79_13280 [Spirochaeta sp.]|nr:hypothetical protein [Spirochaeta sp.]
MKKIDYRILFVLLLPAALLLSCSGVPVTENIIISNDNEGRHSLSFCKCDFAEIEQLSIVVEAEDLKLIYRNSPEDRTDYLISIEWDDNENQTPFQSEVYKSNDNLSVILKTRRKPIPTVQESTVRIYISDTINIRQIESISDSSSADLRLSGLRIDSLNIETSVGSNYVELNNCSAERISINSDYGRSYLLMNRTEISSELTMTGNPESSEVPYYDKVAGAVHAEIIESVISGEINFYSVNGKIEVYSEDSVFFGPISSTSTRGMHFYDLWDCKIQTDSPISAVSDSGKIYFKMAQHETNGNDININLNSRSEEIYFRVWGPLDKYRYDITTLTWSGGKEFHSYENFTAIEEGVRYRSNNFSAPLELITVKAETESGRIYTRVVDCYKKLRFCGDYKTMRPLEPPF